MPAFASPPPRLRPSSRLRPDRCETRRTWLPLDAPSMSFLSPPFHFRLRLATAGQAAFWPGRLSASLSPNAGSPAKRSVALTASRKLPSQRVLEGFRIDSGCGLTPARVAGRHRLHAYGAGGANKVRLGSDLNRPDLRPLAVRNPAQSASLPSSWTGRAMTVRPRGPAPKFRWSNRASRYGLPLRKRLPALVTMAST